MCESQETEEQDEPLHLAVIGYSDQSDSPDTEDRVAEIEAGLANFVAARLGSSEGGYQRVRIRGANVSPGTQMMAFANREAVAMIRSLEDDGGFAFGTIFYAEIDGQNLPAETELYERYREDLNDLVGFMEEPTSGPQRPVWPRKIRWLRYKDIEDGPLSTSIEHDEIRDIWPPPEGLIWEFSVFVSDLKAAVDSYTESAPEIDEESSPRIGSVAGDQDQLVSEGDTSVDSREEQITARRDWKFENFEHGELTDWMSRTKQLLDYTELVEQLRSERQGLEEAKRDARADAGYENIAEFERRKQVENKARSDYGFTTNHGYSSTIEARREFLAWLKKVERKRFS